MSEPTPEELRKAHIVAARLEGKPVCDWTKGSCAVLGNLERFGGAQPVQLSRSTWTRTIPCQWVYGSKQCLGR